MKKRSRTEYSLINMFTGMVGYGINTAVGFICRIIFVRTLSADYLGVSGLFSNILSMLSLAELGISSAITFALYKPLAQGDDRKTATIMQFYRKAYTAIGCIVAVIGLAMLPFLDVIIPEPPAIKESIYLLYLLYLVNTVTSYFFSYRQALLTADQRQYIVTGYNYVITIGQSLAQTVYLLLTHEYIGYLLIQVAGGLIYNVWISWKAGKDYPYIRQKDAPPLEREEQRSLFRNIKALAINKVAGVLVNSTDNIAISFFNGISSVGYASNYTLLSSTLNSLVTLLFNGLTGSVGNLNATADEDTRYRFFKVLQLANFWLYGWAAIGMALVSSDLVQWFYGNEYVMSMKIPLILALNLYTMGMLHASYTYKSTLGLFRYGQYLVFITGVINVALDVILGKQLGIFGIYLATLIARACTTLWYEPYAVYRYGLQKNPLLYHIRYWVMTTLLMIVFGACYWLCSLCTFSPAGNSIIKILICTILPNGVFFAVFQKTEDGMYLISRIRSILTHILLRRN